MEASADPLLLKTRKNTEEVVKTLSADYQQSEYASGARAKISQIISNTVSLISIFKRAISIKLPSTVYSTHFTLVAGDFMKDFQWELPCVEINAWCCRVAEGNKLEEARAVPVLSGNAWRSHGAPLWTWLEIRATTGFVWPCMSWWAFVWGPSSGASVSGTTPSWWALNYL